MAWSVTSKVGWLALTWASSALPLSRAASKVLALMALFVGIGYRAAS